MEKSDAQPLRGRRIRFLPAALLATAVWGGIGAAVWRAPDKPAAEAAPGSPEAASPSVVTFEPRSAVHLASVLDAVWKEVGKGDGVPGVAPVSLPADMDRLDTETRKRTFLRAIVPYVLAANREISEDRGEIERIAERAPRNSGGYTDEDLEFLSEACRRYRLPEGLESLDAGDVAAAVKLLLERVDEVPVRLALAQAALESAWGASRLAREVNGIFGQCAVDAGKEPLVRPAPNGLWYARFGNLREAVKAYVLNLNTFWAYEDFRRVRREMRTKGVPLDALRLAGGLLAYSELGEWYVDKIRAVIRGRDIAAFKHARLESSTSGASGTGVGRSLPVLALGEPGPGPDV